MPELEALPGRSGSSAAWRPTNWSAVLPAESALRPQSSQSLLTDGVGRLAWWRYERFLDSPQRADCVWLAVTRLSRPQVILNTLKPMIHFSTQRIQVQHSAFFASKAWTLIFPS